MRWTEVIDHSVNSGFSTIDGIGLCMYSEGEGDEVLLACEALLVTLRPWTLNVAGCNSHVDFIVRTQMMSYISFYRNVSFIFVTPTSTETRISLFFPHWNEKWSRWRAKWRWVWRRGSGHSDGVWNIECDGWGRWGEGGALLVNPGSKDPCASICGGRHLVRGPKGNTRLLGCFLLFKLTAH